METMLNIRATGDVARPASIRIAVIDDHPLFREGIMSALMHAVGIEVVGEGATASDAITIARECNPDAMLLDLHLPGGGISAAANITRACPKVRVIALTASEDEHDVIAALDAGARGYLLKGSSGFEVIETVRAVVRGESYVTPNLAARLLINKGSRIEAIAVSSPSNLSSREEEVFALISQGKSNKEVARKLNCAERTIKHHMTNIMQKLNVRNRVEAALKFQKPMADAAGNLLP